MTAVPAARLSLPLHGNRPPLTEEQLHRHSYDLSLFPLYLSRKTPARVRVEITTSHQNDPDLMALYDSDSDSDSDSEAPGAGRLFARLLADEQGVLTDSDDLYRAIHAAFAGHASAGRYIGFTRYGRPPYAPLFALALLYRKYGRGLYLAGDMLPTPWPALTSSYAFK